MYEGILYVTTHLGTHAIDATTCKKIWTHSHVAQGPEMNATNKGVAIAGGRVIRGTQDGFLFALDAKTGAPLWVRQVADWSRGEGIGAAPIVLDDIVYVAKAGSDWGIRGQMMAFNVRDGSLAWKFDHTGVWGDGVRHMEDTGILGSRRRSGVGHLRAGPGNRNLVRTRGQPRSRLQKGHAPRRKSIYGVDSRAAMRAAANSNGGTNCVRTTTMTGTQRWCRYSTRTAGNWSRQRASRACSRRVAPGRQARLQTAHDNPTQSGCADHARRRSSLSRRRRAMERCGA